MKKSLMKEGKLSIKPLQEIQQWNTKRIVDYKNRLHKHLSYIQTPGRKEQLINDEGISEKDLSLQKIYVESYINSIKIILKSRENIKS